MRALLVTVCLTSLACIPAPGDRQLRVCAAPDELPFSDREGRGFENQIAQVLATQLGLTLKYAWAPAQDCDVMLRAPRNEAFVSTRPYYRSSYVFLTRADRELYFRSIDDPRLQGLRFGIEVAGDGTLSKALERRGFNHAKTLSSAASLISAVREDQLDVGLVWGPSAGTFARGDDAPLRMSIIDAAGDEPSFSADVCLGVRRDRTALKESLEKALVERRDAIDDILRQHGVPLTGL